MAKTNHHFICPIGEALNVFSGRWKPEIIWHLRCGDIRFNQLQKLIENVSKKVLTQQLRELERDGLVKRTQYEGLILRVEYQLTELANSLEPIFGQLEAWLHENRDIINKSQKKYNASKEYINLAE